MNGGFCMNKLFFPAISLLFILLIIGEPVLLAQSSNTSNQIDKVGIRKDGINPTFESQLKELEIGLLKQEKQFKQLELQGQRDTMFWIFALVVVLGASVVLVILAFMSKARSRKKLLNLNQEMEAQNVEIALKNSEIESQRDMLEKQNNQIRKINSDLEGLVEDRTGDLQDALKEVTRSKEELDTFVYRASHDLRGPIVRMQGLATVAKIGAENEEVLNYLGLLEYSALNLERVLRKLIQVRHIANRIPEIEEVDFSALLQEVKTDLKSLGAEMLSRVEVVGSENVSLQTDADLFKIIMSNLLENGLVFTEKASNSVVRIQLVELENGYELVVEDRGEGIAPEIRDKVFEMFFRGSLKSRGNGLGLYLVQSAAAKLGGKVRLESEPGTFTRLRVRLPMPRSQRGKQAVKDGALN